MTGNDALTTAKEKVASEQEELSKLIRDIFRVCSAEQNNYKQETIG